MFKIPDEEKINYEILVYTDRTVDQWFGIRESNLPPTLVYEIRNEYGKNNDPVYGYIESGSDHKYELGKNILEKWKSEGMAKYHDESKSLSAFVLRHGELLYAYVLTPRTGGIEQFPAEDIFLGDDRSTEEIQSHRKTYLVKEKDHLKSLLKFPRKIEEVMSILAAGALTITAVTMGAGMITDITAADFSTLGTGGKWQLAILSVLRNLCIMLDSVLIGKLLTILAVYPKIRKKIKEIENEINHPKNIRGR